MGANLIIASVAPGAQGLSSPLTTPATWIFLAPIIIFLFLFFRVGLANGGVKYFWDWLIARLPGMGKIMREFSMAKFGRAFGALYKGGIPLTQCVQMAADACGNEYLRSRMYPAVKILESGAGITETFQSTGAFSPLVIDMVQTGEMTGSLDKMLGKMAEFYEDEAATKSTQLAQITGVVLGLLVAIYIGFIVISFYTGYFGGVMKNA
jgi:type II secretory pathway component PulF